MAEGEWNFDPGSWFQPAPDGGTTTPWNPTGAVDNSWQQPFQDFGQGVGQGVQQVSDWGQGVFNQGVQGISDWSQGVGQSFGQGVQQVSDWGQQASKDFWQGLQQVGDFGQQFGHEVSEGLQEASMPGVALGYVLGEAARPKSDWERPLMVQPGARSYSMTMEGPKDGSEGFGGEVKQFLGNAERGLGGLVGEASSNFNSLTKAFGQGLGGVPQSIETVVKPLGNGLSTWWNGLGPQVEKGANDFLQGGQALGSQIDTFRESVGKPVYGLFGQEWKEDPTGIRSGVAFGPGINYTIPGSAMVTAGLTALGLGGLSALGIKAAYDKGLVSDTLGFKPIGSSITLDELKSLFSPRGVIGSTTGVGQGIAPSPLTLLYDSKMDPRAKASYATSTPPQPWQVDWGRLALGVSSGLINPLLGSAIVASSITPGSSSKGTGLGGSGTGTVQWAPGSSSKGTAVGSWTAAGPAVPSSGLGGSGTGTAKWAPGSPSGGSGTGTAPTIVPYTWSPDNPYKGKNATEINEILKSQSSPGTYWAEMSPSYVKQKLDSLGYVPPAGKPLESPSWVGIPNPGQIYNPSSPEGYKALRDQGYRQQSDGSWRPALTGGEFYDTQKLLDMGFYSIQNGKIVTNRDMANTDMGRNLFNMGYLSINGQYVLPNSMNTQGVDSNAFFELSKLHSRPEVQKALLGSLYVEGNDSLNKSNLSALKAQGDDYFQRSQWANRETGYGPLWKVNPSAVSPANTPSFYSNAIVVDPSTGQFVSQRNLSTWGDAYSKAGMGPALNFTDGVNGRMYRTDSELAGLAGGETRFTNPPIVVTPTSFTKPGENVKAAIPWYRAPADTNYLPGIPPVGGYVPNMNLTPTFNATSPTYIPPSTNYRPYIPVAPSGGCSGRTCPISPIGHLSNPNLKVYSEPNQLAKLPVYYGEILGEGGLPSGSSLLAVNESGQGRINTTSGKLFKNVTNFS